MPDQVVNIGGEDNVVEQGGVVAADDGNQAAPQPNGPMHWSHVQSGFMLKRFHDLVGQGVICRLTKAAPSLEQNRSHGDGCEALLICVVQTLTKGDGLSLS